MATKRQGEMNQPRATKSATPGDAPRLFRVNLEVGDLKSAISFYTKLLGVEGRKQAGSRCSFDCGPVTLQVLEVSSVSHPHSAANSLYFVVSDLEALYERARALQCLSSESVHGRAGGGIVVRPWGERSFYVEDHWKNPLCFVDDGTVYPG